MLGLPLSTAVTVILLVLLLMVWRRSGAAIPRYGWIGSPAFHEIEPSWVNSWRGLRSVLAHRSR